MFKDRVDAGRQLAEKLAKYAAQKCIIYALPRGGVPVGYEVCLALKKPLETIIVKKLGVPGQEELALGAVTEGEPPTFYYNKSLMNYMDFRDSEIAEIAREKLEEIRQIQSLYRGTEEMYTDKGAVAILVDDGIATGATMKAAINFLKKVEQKRIVVAVPVGEKHILDEIRKMVDDVICVDLVGTMYAVGEFYSDFSETKHETVVELLTRARKFSGRP